MDSLPERIEDAEGPDRRLLDRLDRSGDCWLWTGALDYRGRGRVWHRGKLKLHHRAVWEILCGSIPEGSLLCHHCDNPRCANPDHLYIGDAVSNAQDMARRGRAWAQRNPEKAKALGKRTGSQNSWARREKNPKAKLNETQVTDIAASEEPNRVLADRYGVHITTIQRIRRGALWN